MKKLTKFLFLCDILVILVILGMVMADKEVLRENVIRLHVVANSDSAEDQSVKLKVKDAVTDMLETRIQQFDDPQEAKEYLACNLDKICNRANEVLKAEGLNLTAKVSLEKEKFPIRHYDTFSLPSGVYESLRITIGEGAGQNWWCVVFPSLCIAASSEDVEACAAGAGFSNGLTSALTDQDGYEIGFFLLDCLGRLENLFYWQS